MRVEKRDSALASPGIIPYTDAQVAIKKKIVCLINALMGKLMGFLIILVSKYRVDKYTDQYYRLTFIFLTPYL